MKKPTESAIMAIRDLSRLRSGKSLVEIGTKITAIGVYISIIGVLAVVFGHDMAISSFYERCVICHGERAVDVISKACNDLPQKSKC